MSEERRGDKNVRSIRKCEEWVMSKRVERNYRGWQEKGWMDILMKTIYS